MRPEFLRGQISDYIPETSWTSSERATPIGTAEAARDLFDLLAVIIGVCESLTDVQSPQHAELARVGLLAADRAADLVAELRAQAAAGPGRTAPEASAAALALPAVLPTAVAAQPGRKVLLVEDDPNLLSLLTAAFAREGFESHTAQNGRVGVEMLQKLKPDLMVTDIVMPEMEGIAAILEARRAAPNTRVIAISGGGHYGKSQNFLAWAHELGADEVLAKPFRMSSLITAARVVLDRPAGLTAANETIPGAGTLAVSARPFRT